MNLTERITEYRRASHRTWNFASSQDWYANDGQWMQRITQSAIYQAAMITPEEQMMQTIAEYLAGTQPGTTFVALGPGDAKKEVQLMNALDAKACIAVDINAQELSEARYHIPVPTTAILGEFRAGVEAARHVASKFIYLGSTYSNLRAFDYDLLAHIDASMYPGDMLYVSAQTTRHRGSIPLYIEQYRSGFHEMLNKHVLEMAGVMPARHAVWYDPATEEVNIGCVVRESIGIAKRLGVAPGDLVITHLSHKPKSLTAEMQARFPRYGLKPFSESATVCVGENAYLSTYAGVLLTKLTSR